MKEFIIKIGIMILKIIYLPMKMLKTQNKIVYISRQFNHPTLDFVLLEREIKRFDNTVENIILTKRIEKGVLKSVSYMLHMLKQMYHIATSKVVILDSYCIVISVLKHKKETKIIQLWHALGAIKKFGYQTIGKTSGASENTANVMCMHKNYDYILCSSKETSKYYLEAFNTDKSKIKYMAMPRVDYLLQEKNKDKIYEEYPQLKNKVNVLYVPTFRKGKRIKLNRLIEKFDTNKYNLIIKLHPLDRKQYTYSEKEGVIFENKFKSYDLFEVSDRIITDYSSLAIEASLLNKPIYFYTYDIEEYKKDPGLNIDFEEEEIGKYLAKTSNKIIELLEEEYDYSILENFKNKYITVDINNCTEKLSKYILELINNENNEDDKKVLDSDSKKKLNV